MHIPNAVRALPVPPLVMDRFCAVPVLRTSWPLVTVDGVVAPVIWSIAERTSEILVPATRPIVKPPATPVAPAGAVLEKVMVLLSTVSVEPSTIGVARSPEAVTDE